MPRAGVCVVVLILLVGMASFDLQAFFCHPSHVQLEKCREDDLIEVANHFCIPIRRQALKKLIKSDVVNYLVETKVFLETNVEGGGDIDSLGADMQTPHVHEEWGQKGIATAEAEAGAKAGLSLFDPHTSISSETSGGARLQVRLARLHLEVQDKVQARQGELDLRLEIHRLEIEADKEVKMRQLELEAMKVTDSSVAQPNPGKLLNASSPPETPAVSFDISKHIALVPHFRETEVDFYFSVFERIATSLSDGQKRCGPYCFNVGWWGRHRKFALHCHWKKV